MSFFENFFNKGAIKENNKNSIKMQHPYREVERIPDIEDDFEKGFTDAYFKVVSKIDKDENGKEKEVEIDLENELKYWSEFYNEHNIKGGMPKLENLTKKQIKDMKIMAESGFDKIIIIPALAGASKEEDEKKYNEELNNIYLQIHNEMTNGYNRTKENESFKDDGGFEAINKEIDYSKPQIIFTREARNIYGSEDPILNGTLKKRVEDLRKWIKGKNLMKNITEDEKVKEKVKKLEGKIGGISMLEYLIMQREYAERKAKDKGKEIRKARHLDDKSSTLCLMDSFDSGRAPVLNWNFDIGRLEVCSVGISYSSLGCRLSGRFVM